MWEPFEARLREKLAAMPNGDRALARLAWLLNVRRIRWWVWLLAYGPPLAFALHAQLTYSPLQRWLAERQLEQFGAYYPTLTASFIAGALSALWGLPILIVALARLARQTDAASPAASGAPAGTARVDAAEARADRAAALIIAVIVGAIPLGWGGAKWIGAARAGSLVEIDTAQLERGEAPTGSFVRLLGKPVFDRAIVTKQRGAKEWEKTAYVPLVSADWKADDAIAAVVVAPSWKLDPIVTAGEIDAKGTIRSEGLGPVSTMFEQDRTKLAPRVWVVELGNTPVRDLRQGQGLVALALPLAVFAWFVARRRVTVPVRS